MLQLLPTRTRCRRCKAVLTEPTSSDRSAFCCAGCHRLYFARRCMACDAPKTGAAATCGKRSCERELAAFKRHGVMGKFTPRKRRMGQVPSHAKSASKSDNSIALAGAPNAVEQAPKMWRQIAGPPVNIHLATVGGDEAVKATNRTNRKYWLSDRRTLIKKSDPPINVIGGYKFQSAPIAPDFPTTPPTLLPAAAA